MSETVGLPSDGEVTELEMTSLLSLGDLASRHLIARTSATDVITKSIEEIAKETENQSELQSLFEGITNPYNELFLRHCKGLPRKSNKKVFREFNDYLSLKSGSWIFSEATDNGVITSAVTYGYKGSRSAPAIKGATVDITSLNDLDAKLVIGFEGNKIHEVTLKWESYNAHNKPQTLLKKLKGTELGEAIDVLLGPDVLRGATGSQSLTFTLGSHPNISASRHAHYYPEEQDKNEKGRTGRCEAITNSDLQYHSIKNQFLRQHGLGDWSESDNLTALNPEEAAVILHQLLSLIPTVSL